MKNATSAVKMMPEQTICKEKLAIVSKRLYAIACIPWASIC